jgi:hypothetical protein
MRCYHPGTKAARHAITEFTLAVTTEGSPDFLPAPERIAVFDSDGTLRCEIPTVQLMFVLDRVKQMAPEHPDWAGRQPFAAALDGDMAALAGTGEQGLTELVVTTHAGNTPEQFAAIVTHWLAAARHPTFHRPYTETVYRPMLELMGFLRQYGFKIFIVPGGGVEFMRAWAERVYGVPPEHIIGSSIKTRFQLSASGSASLIRLPEMDFIDDGPGKPVAIGKFIGRRPIAAFGNSDGDLQMLQYTTSGPGRRFGLIAHHDDADREVSHDRQSRFGRLATALDLAPAAGWSVVLMKNDWSQIFPLPP